MYLDANGNVIPGLSTEGYLAVAVPGTPAGLDYVLQRYGTLSRAAVIGPAVGLAINGFVLGSGDIDWLHPPLDSFRTQPNIARIFLKDDNPYQVGDRVLQPELGRTLILLAVFGPMPFYQGPIADKIVDASNANGGILTKADFLNYSVEELMPLRSQYRGFDLVLAPPPSSGGVMIAEILNVLSGYPMAKLGYHSPSALHFLIEASRNAFADRTLLGDPDYNPHLPLSYMLSLAHAAEIRAQINPITATPSTSVRPGQPAHEGVETTHYSVVDQWGNAVAVTYTINSLFGARCMASDTGFFLNNEMDDFTAKPDVPNQFGLIQGEQNGIAAGKRPLSSMSPTIVLKDGKAFLVTGSPGGSRIITTTLETIIDVVDYNMDIQSAVDSPRIHHQWLPDTVYYESDSLSQETEKALLRKGYNLTPRAPWGSAQSIEIPYRDIRTRPTIERGRSRAGILLRQGIRYGGWDHRSPAGSANGE